MLAQAANYAGLKPIVIDMFADIDTQFFSYDIFQIPALSKEYLIPIVDKFVKQYSLTQAFFGSGFECYPECLRYLSGCLTVIGNQYDIFVKTQEIRTFFSALNTLNIPYPDISFTKPEHTGSWLIKPLSGYGGVGVKRCFLGGDIVNSVYWQKFQAGTQQSVLFLADGVRAQVVGFNTQWTIKSDEGAEFIFSGIINNCNLSDKHKQTVSSWLDKLVPTFGLLGLNSLDFIHAEGRSYVLEINPRPPASMQLYDADLLGRHMCACQGRLTDDLIAPTWVTGYQIIYAGHDLVIPQQFIWPLGSMDIPKAGSLIRKGYPICSIMAHEKNPQLVFAQLAARQQLLIKNLKGTN
jgi:uncharacterized protein